MRFVSSFAFVSFFATNSQMTPRGLRARFGIALSRVVVLSTLGIAATTALFAQGAATNFGSVNIGSTSSAIPVTLTFATSDTLASTLVLTQGATRLDYADAGSDTCTANTTYSSGQSCTVNVSFTPKFSGTRNGAVVLNDANGNVIATAYLEGTGMGPQVNFMPGVESGIAVSGNSAPLAIAVDGAGNLFVLDNRNGIVAKEALSAGGYTQTTIASGLSDPQAVAVDGAGNVYIADMGNSRVLKETPAATGYTESTVDSGFGFPYGVAVDGGGNVYIADGENNRILEETPSPNGYTQSTAVSGLGDEVMSVAVDGNGNLYIADGNDGPGLLLKETRSNGTFTQSALPVNGQIAPQSVAVDGLGNVYFEDAETDNIFKETPTSNGYVESTVISDLHTPSGPWGVAVDENGNVYTGYPALNEVVKADFADAPSLAFANTAVGSTSTDSPKTVTLENVGDAALVLSLPTAGNNPSIGLDFTLSNSGQTDCPLLNSGSSSPATLAAGASCELSVSFAPTVSGALAESLVVSDNNLNSATPAYATQTIPLTGTAAPPALSITWPAPAAITYGTPLGAAQLDATANVPGTFAYSPVAGTVLGAGNQTITVTFTPTNTTEYTTATATVTLTVSKVTPTIMWPAPSSITAGTALSSTQLDATASVPGTFAYSPSTGTVLAAGSQTLTTIFTPADTADYNSATASVILSVTAPPSFKLNASPSSLTVAQGKSGTVTITVAGQNGFNSSVTLSLSALPKGVTAAIGTNPTTGSSVLTFKAGPSSKAGTYPVAVSGVSGSLSSSSTISLTID